MRMEKAPTLMVPNFPITKSCHSQIADKLEIPFKYYHKMEELFSRFGEIVLMLRESTAITLAAQKEETWEKSVELERIGGSLISLPFEEFKSLDD